jgi:hypothetical protein
MLFFQHLPGSNGLHIDMRRMRILCFLALLILAARPALARLGETSQAMEKRYGPAISSGSLPGFTQSVYEKGGFAITVFYKDGVSVLEKFATRGMSQATARQVVVLVAATQIGSPDASEEAVIRQASGITSKDEVFWAWTAADGQPINAAFNPLECCLAFFGDPVIYASVQQALASVPLPGG